MTSGRVPNTLEIKNNTPRCAILTVGQVLSYGLSFARSVLLARLLTKADFGLAAMFGMTLSILEIAGRMSFGQQIIQSKDGDTESFQATSQAFQSVLVTFQALLLICLSYPLALAFKVRNLLGHLPYWP